MKRLISLLCICFMMVSFVYIPALASDITINAKDVIPGGQGVGFFDNTENSDSTEPESAGENQIYLRGGEWVKYDVEALAEGTYEVSIKRRATAWARQRVFIDFFVDDILALKKNIEGNVTSYSDMVLGKVYISEDSETVKLLNSGLYNDYFLWLESITFTYLGEGDMTEDEYDITFHAHNIKSINKADSATSDGGFWDAAGLTLPNGNLIENLSYTQHAGDWTKYDISGLKRGTYTLYLEACASANPLMTISIDGQVIYMDRSFSSTGSYSVSREDELGKIFLNGTESELKINTTTAAVFLRGVRFKLESESNLLLDSSLRIEAETSIPGGQNEAYWDNGTIPTRLDVLEIYTGATGNTICHRTEEWVKYKIANLEPGKYELSVSSSSKLDATFDVLIDGEKVISGSVVPLQGSYEDFETNRLGYIEIGENESYIMKVSMPSGLSYIDYYELNKVFPFEVLEFTSNEAENGIIKRGSDELRIITNNKINEKTYDKVKVKDESGNSLDAEVSLSDDGKELIISLKESLAFNTSYTVDLKEVTDEFEQNIDGDSNLEFVTADETEDSGQASFGPVTKDKTENNLKIEGYVLSSKNLGIKNRKVVLKRIYPSGETIETKETLSKEDGYFEFGILYNDADEKGAYTYEITTDYAKESKVLKDSFFGDELNEIITKAINGKDTWQEAKAALKENEETLGIDVEGAGTGLNMEYVYKQFVKRNFTKASDVTDEFNTYVVVELINQAKSADDVLSVLEDKEKGALLNVDYKNWELCDDTLKANIAEKIFNKERIDNKDELKEFIKDVLASDVSKFYGASSPEIYVSSPVITEGDGGVLKIAFNEKQENVKSIHIEISYGKGAVFDNEPLDAKIKIEDAEKEISKKDGKISINIEREYILDDVKDICELTVTTLSGDSGEYDFKVDGYCVFDLENAGKIAVDFPKKAEGTLTVNKKQSSSGKKPSGSGGGGGISSYRDIPIASATKEPAATPEPITTPEKEGFTDVADSHWAKTAIDVLSKMGVINGRDAKTFDPESPVTRAEFLKILLKAQNIKEGGTSSFSDVKENEWFYPYVSKACELGIVKGTDEGRFNPNSKITREDMVTISFRLLKNISGASGKTPTFEDLNDISDYAKEAVGGLFAMGMISGVGENKFAPKTTVSRAMAAQFAYNMLYPKDVEITEKQDPGQRQMAAKLENGKLSVRTNFDEKNALVQEFTGFKADNMESNAVVNFGASGIANLENEDLFVIDKVLGSGVDEPAPFNINNAYIAANHGQPAGVLVTGAHNKTYKDLGSVWKDEAGTNWNLLKVCDNSELLFISDNYGSSENEYSFIREMKGNLSYVSDGVNKEEIKVASTKVGQQVWASTKITDKKVYAVIDGVGYLVNDGETVVCDYVDIVEKYEIINPATIAEGLRKDKPSGGYETAQDIAKGKSMVKYNMTYRITPDGAVTSIFDHEIVSEVKVNFYSAVMAQERENAFGGGVYRYIPKISSFTSGDKEYDFIKGINATDGDIPDVVLGTAYWENENDAPNREVSYMKNADGAVATLFADGYVPVFDGAIGVREEKVNAWGFLYPTKKHYPYFVTSKAFEKTGTKGQHIKGVGYKKYESALNNLSELGNGYTVPYGNDLYLYIDYQNSGEDLVSFEKISNIKEVSLVEKSDNVSYNVDNGKLSVKVTDSKAYGYLVLKLSGAGYGHNSYSDKNYSDKYVTEK